MKTKTSGDLLTSSASLRGCGRGMKKIVLSLSLSRFFLVLQLCARSQALALLACSPMFEKLIG